eukprot:TRINITY_DN26706_c0_g3_i1.p1 TRINITY_DN26706_c0_g3~~TRINITY_DN26706_c0_g3_i1.p1  ORF type:complete len:599 (-),score=178.30 TRINITY_DN26706_c0_g3_i1:245-2041(-)
MSVRKSYRRGSVDDSLQLSDGKHSPEVAAPEKHKPVFPSAKEMKDQLRNNMKKKKYDVSMYYHETGHFRDLATNQIFENVTLSVISLNALWISIDTDYNDADTLLKADPIFIVAENFFCAYFTFEWAVRFGAFKNKFHGVHDAWFVFDTLMCAMMVFETWAMPLFLAISGSDGNMGNASLLRLLRLLRLSRMARMARLLKSMPELLILIRGMIAAIRSVFFTLFLLMIAMYVFAIFFRQTTSGEVNGEYFETVVRSMHSLWQYGVMLDAVGDVSKKIADMDKMPYMCLCGWYLFILLGALTIMNMLIGVLCEVITAVAQTEQEEMTIMSTREQLQDIIDNSSTHWDEASDTHAITKSDFLVIFEKAETAALLNEIEVDVLAMVDLVDTIFTSEDGTERVLDFPGLLEVMLDHRSSKMATVKDVVDMRKYCRARLDKLADQIKNIQTREVEGKLKLETQIATLGEMIEKAAGVPTGTYVQQAGDIENKLMAEYRAEQEAKRQAEKDRKSAAAAEACKGLVETRGSMTALPPPKEDTEGPPSPTTDGEGTKKKAKKKAASAKKNATIAEEEPAVSVSEVVVEESQAPAEGNESVEPKAAG